MVAWDHQQVYNSLTQSPSLSRHTGSDWEKFDHDCLKMLVCHFYFFKDLLFLIMCMSVCWHVRMSEDVWRPQKRVLDHLELQLQTDLIDPMSVLGNQIWVLCKNSTSLL